MLGLTHPAEKVSWFGLRLGHHFFRLVPGDRYVAVLYDPRGDKLVDAIPYEGGEADPRPALNRMADEWARRRGYRVR